MNLAALRAVVRRGDYEGYLCGSFMPTAARESYYAMRAFNIEVAGVRDTARGNAQPARLRLGFWRDFVAACVTALNREAGHRLSQRHF